MGYPGSTHYVVMYNIINSFVSLSIILLVLTHNIMCFIEINRKFTSSNVKLSVAAENYNIYIYVYRTKN